MTGDEIRKELAELNERLNALKGVTDGLLKDLSWTEGLDQGASGPQEYDLSALEW